MNQATLQNLNLRIFGVFVQILLIVNLSFSQTLNQYFLQSRLDESLDSDSLCVSRYLPLVRKNSVTQMHGLAVYVKQGLPLKTMQQVFIYVFEWLYFIQCPSFIVLYRSPSSSFCTVFYSISSNIDEFLSIKLPDNVFV